jgi:uncharacterized protein YdeI (YjbR/CyaY-like superfamily)
VKPRFFRSAADLRRWLAAHHASEKELIIGFYKKDSGRVGITYSEALDEALCFGWIDGVRRSLDEKSYTNRFTPRRPRSNWSQVNMRRVRELIRMRRMRRPGLAAYERRDDSRTNRYSFERESAELAPGHRRVFRANRAAWKFFESQPPYYRRVVTWWVISARKEETRLRRLQALIACCARGERIPQLKPKPAGPTRSTLRRGTPRRRRTRPPARA